MLCPCSCPLILIPIPVPVLCLTLTLTVALNQNGDTSYLRGNTEQTHITVNAIVPNQLHYHITANIALQFTRNSEFSEVIFSTPLLLVVLHLCYCNAVIVISCMPLLQK